MSTPTISDRKDTRSVVRLGDICEVLHSRVQPIQGGEDGLSIPVITGADLRKEVIVRDELRVADVREKPSTSLALRQGDILVPVVTKRPKARLIGPDLEGVYPHHTVRVLRPTSSGPSPARVLDYLTSHEFFEELSQRVSLLRGDLRVSAADLVDMPFVLPLEDDAPSASVVMLVEQLARDLIALIAENRLTLREIEWRDLERVLAKAFDGLGFDVELTPSSKDGGKDLVLHCMEQGTRRRYVVEVKHWVSGKRVGSTELLKFVEVVAKENHDAGLFLSTSGFNRNAYKAEAHLEHRRVRLAGEDKVMRICQMFVATQSGVLAPKQSLGQVFHDGTWSIATAQQDATADARASRS
ncbi:restriction endonuclease [Halomonas sp. M4R1S46]|uniref:restriction endonuclease n=1 Tax=Halomonas sp. M4R1S46 TaxID=2982692 RepID=UPI0021E3C35D|nr:restriction endonuclease [Halomonas sp. M4R1S46]UYG09079.1 restriction endonuclease [Halomonas sp. M4R1S46]